MNHVIHTSRCILSPLCIQNYDDLSTLYADEKARKYLGGIVTGQQFKQKFNDLINQNSYQWAAKTKNNSTFIGLVSIDKYHDNTNYEISYQLIQEMTGKGLGYEIAKQVIDFSFKEMKLRKIIAETQSKNSPSVKLLKKLGMKLESKVMRFNEEQCIYSLENKNPQ